jgi:hypothetical protein
MRCPTIEGIKMSKKKTYSMQVIINGETKKAVYDPKTLQVEIAGHRKMELHTLKELKPEVYDQIYSGINAESQDDEQDDKKKEDGTEVLLRDLDKLEATWENEEEGDLFYVKVHGEYTPVKTYKDVVKAYLRQFGTRADSLRYKGVDAQLHNQVVGSITPYCGVIPAASPKVAAKVDTSWIYELEDVPPSLEVEELLSRMSKSSKENLFALVLGLIYGLTTVKHQRVFLLWGKGGEGKSALNTALSTVFAVQKAGRNLSYNMENFGNTHTASYIAGKTYVYTEEEPVTAGSLKFARKLSGRMMGNPKGKEIITFLPVCNYVHITNYKITTALLRETDGRANSRRVCPILLAPRKTTEEDGEYVDRLTTGIPYLAKLALAHIKSLGITEDALASKFSHIVHTLESKESIEDFTRLGGIISAEYNFYNDFIPYTDSDKVKQDPEHPAVFERGILEDYFRNKLLKMNEYHMQYQVVRNITNSVVEGMIGMSKVYLEELGYRYKDSTSITHVFGFKQRKKKNAKNMIESCDQGEGLLSIEKIPEHIIKQVKPDVKNNTTTDDDDEELGL